RQRQGDEEGLPAGEAPDGAPFVCVAVVDDFDTAVVERQRVGPAGEVVDQLVGAVDQRRQRLGQHPRLEAVGVQVLGELGGDGLFFPAPGDGLLQVPALFELLFDRGELGLGGGQRRGQASG